MKTITIEIDEPEPDILERMDQMFSVCECSDEVCLFGPDDERCVLCPSNQNGLFFSLFGEDPPR